MPSVLLCYHEMPFEMFTEHEVELFALHINVFNLNEMFLSICMQHTDNNIPRKWFLGASFWYCVLQDRWSFWGLCPLDPLGVYSTPPDNQLLQAMKYGHCISCVRQDTTFIHTLTTNLAHHSKFLKNGLPWTHSPPQRCLIVCPQPIKGKRLCGVPLQISER